MKLREFIEGIIERGVDLDSELTVELPASMEGGLLDVEEFTVFISTGQQNKIIFNSVDNN